MQVTIQGVSAGSISVAHHLVSPRSRGLFHGAIASSGVTGGSFGRNYKSPWYYTRYKILENGIFNFNLELMFLNNLVQDYCR